MVGALTALPTIPAEAAAAAPEASCAADWGSLGKSGGTGPNESFWVVDARTGRHACFDRFVVDFAVAPNGVGYRVRYVDRFRSQQSGELIAVPGGARLQVVVHGSNRDYHGELTYDGVVGYQLPRVDLRGYETFRSTRFGGSVSARTQFAVGVRARLPFRVFLLDHRVVVDVAHHW